MPLQPQSRDLDLLTNHWARNTHPHVDIQLIFQATERHNVAAFSGLKKGESGNGKLALEGPLQKLASMD
jgi:hypothetical protein